ncbi:winged helix-turn-helix domain-containing protein [Ornithinimicrobium pratense]|uniref:Helix-turn-helix transcriptional regulator n=1 Tax=Ornithinimicrobium pratense TaxID=2593973 RepID=A0A5J6V3K0_9MICO|nr:helix-turn-helix domain-containing protein [Ornithinimicrobium pratense]QFG67884.1 helix-turn-helix transcriptional regulator [Ornithinimicrobium pratense]
MAAHVRMTSPMLKAMTHPLRRRIVSLMRHDQPMRAVDLARQLDVPANSVSFHLRTLADAGMIIEAPEHARDRRDRVWVAAGDGFSVPDPGTLQEEDEPALRAYLDQAGIDLQELVRTALVWAVEWSSGRDEVQRAAISLGTLRATRAEIDLLVEELESVIRRTRQRLQESEAGEVRQDWDFLTLVAEAGLGQAGSAQAAPAPRATAAAAGSTDR